MNTGLRERSLMMEEFPVKLIYGRSFGVVFFMLKDIITPIAMIGQ